MRKKLIVSSVSALGLLALAACSGEQGQTTNSTTGQSDTGTSLGQGTDTGTTSSTNSDPLEPSIGQGANEAGKALNQAEDALKGNNSGGQNSMGSGQSDPLGESDSMDQFNNQ